MLAEGSGPPVLLLHGSGPGTTAAAWAPLVAALAPHHRVIAPDLIGFGESPPPTRPLESLRSAWTAQALELLDSLGISSCAVVGNSAGGAIALSLAHARPRAMTRVVAVGSMGHAMTLPAGLDALWGFPPTAEAARELQELLVGDVSTVTEDAIAARLVAMRAQPHYRELFPAPRQRWVDDLSLTEDELAAITMPVLLVHGALDRIVPLGDGALGLLDALPDARAHIFGGAGHATPIERTADFNRLVTTFLETDR
jgi:2-hydroxymuconate-semialdehyde hydrolase